VQFPREHPLARGKIRGGTADQPIGTTTASRGRESTYDSQAPEKMRKP
jgi:hypothetical protein